VEVEVVVEELVVLVPRVSPGPEGVSFAAVSMKSL
jgi:hypothetical protein